MAHAAAVDHYCVIFEHADSEVAETFAARLETEQIPFLLEHPGLDRATYRILISEAHFGACLAKLGSVNDKECSRSLDKDS